MDDSVAFIRATSQLNFSSTYRRHYILLKSKVNIHCVQIFRTIFTYTAGFPFPAISSPSFPWTGPISARLRTGWDVVLVKRMIFCPLRSPSSVSIEQSILYSTLGGYWYAQHPSCLIFSSLNSLRSASACGAAIERIKLNINIREHILCIATVPYSNFRRVLFHWLSESGFAGSLLLSNVSGGLFLYSLYLWSIQSIFHWLST